MLILPCGCGHEDLWCSGCGKLIVFSQFDTFGPPSPKDPQPKDWPRMMTLKEYVEHADFWFDLGSGA